MSYAQWNQYSYYFTGDYVIDVNAILYQAKNPVGPSTVDPNRDTTNWTSLGSTTGGVSNPLNGDLNAGGYNINDVANITVATLNGFPTFPTATIYDNTSTDPDEDLSLYSSASYFVMGPNYTAGSLTFQNSSKTPLLDKSFYNIQNNTSTEISIRWNDGTTTADIGVMGPATVGATVIPCIGVFTIQAGNYAFY